MLTALKRRPWPQADETAVCSGNSAIRENQSLQGRCLGPALGRAKARRCSGDALIRAGPLDTLYPVAFHATPAAGECAMSELVPLDLSSSWFPDPQFEDRTAEPRKTAWAAYAQALTAALDRYETEKLKARSEYLKNRRSYLSGSILRPTLKQLMYVWPTDAQLAEFDELEAVHLAEHERMVFNAAREYARSERDACIAYWKATGASERPA